MERSAQALTELQRDLIIGTLLGDGTMRCKRSALLEVNHSIAQRDYVDWKYGVLRNLVRTPPRLRKCNGSRVAYRFTTLSLRQLTPFFEAFYEGRHKVVRGITITPLSLAVWFMDDGSRSRGSVYLNTQQFDAVSQAELITALFAQYGLQASVNKDKSYKRLRIAVKSVPVFRSLVAPYLLPSLSYKLPPLVKRAHQ